MRNRSEVINPVSPMPPAVAPTLRLPPVEVPAAEAPAPAPAKEDTAARQAAPRKAEVVDAKPGTVDAEPSSLRSFLSKVLAAPAEQPAAGTAIAAGDDPESTVEARQAK